MKQPPNHIDEASPSRGHGSVFDDAGLDGKVAIVTGGGAVGDGIGNGRAVAILLARAGVQVLVVDRQADLAQRTVDMIAEDGGKAGVFEADVTESHQCEAMVVAAVERFGRLDFLDNNVGIGTRGSVVQEEPRLWQLVMRVNVETMFLTSKYAIPAMIDTAGGGAIVNVASIAALMPTGLTAYATSKGAVISLTRAMAVDHGHQGIRVNCVAPGPVYTPMVASPGMPEKLREARRDASVLGIERMGWDIGNAVRFLLSEHARYVTGQTLVVDGGTTLRGPDRH